MTDHPSGFVVEVVDDDQSVLDSLELLLESADYTVRSFDSATVLLDSRCLAEIDYLISDVDMPVINGFQLLPMVHAARPGLPIALITGHPELLSQVPSVGQGHFRLFKKPFNAKELLTAVGDALRIPNLRRRRP